MKKIFCRNCGMEIDPSLGKCHNCGAVYYILPAEDESAATDGSDYSMDQVDQDIMRLFGSGAGSAKNKTPAQGHGDINVASANKDDLFRPGIWKNVPDPDETKHFSAVTREKPAPVQTRRDLGAAVNAARAAQPQNRDLSKAVGAARATQKNKAKAKAGSGSTNPQPPQGNGGMSLRTKQLIVSAVALLALLTLILSFMSGAFDFEDKSKVTLMVDLKGQTEEAATDVLKNSMELDVTVIKDHSEELEGTVIDQSIKVGSKYKKGDKITITVSSGVKQTDETVAKQVTVVPVEGKTYDQALYDLTSIGIVVTRAADVYSDEVEEGKVISQSPAAGTVINEGDIVVITVSKGEEPAPTRTISVTAGTGGSVSPKGNVEVEDGTSQTFTITPNEGYEIKEVKVDGEDVGDVSSYTFENITENHTLYVVFREKTTGEEIVDDILDFFD